MGNFGCSSDLNYLPITMGSIELEKKLLTGNVQDGEHHFILLCTRGHGSVVFASHEVQLREGDLTLVKAGESFSLIPGESGWEANRLSIRCGELLLTSFGVEPNTCIRLVDARHIAKLMRMLDISQGPSEWRFHVRGSELVYRLLLEVSVQIHRRNEHIEGSLADKLKEYIHCYYLEKITVSELSRLFGYSPQHINKLFRKSTGYSVSQYIQKVQLEHAAILLCSEEMSVEKVAEAIGLEWRNFYRHFVRIYQQTPGQFRKLKRIGGLIDKI